MGCRMCFALVIMSSRRLKGGRISITQSVNVLKILRFALDDILGREEIVGYQKTSTPTSEAMLHRRLSSLFGREAEVLFGALKRKSCLSVSEFFLFSVEKCRSSSKSADGSLSFLLPFSFCWQKEKSKSIHTSCTYSYSRL